VHAAPLIAKRWYYRGIYQQESRLFEQAVADLRRAVELQPDHARICNGLARLLAVGPEKVRDSREAVELGERAVALQPGEWTYQNTLGIAYYRASRFADTVAALEKSLQGGAGQSDAFDLYILAMAHYRLGHTALARTCFARAATWHGAQKHLPSEATSELDSFRVEAAAILRRNDKLLGVGSGVDRTGLSREH
jgi:tetratricopeptide (TPR) repeat protein